MIENATTSAEGVSLPGTVDAYLDVVADFPSKLVIDVVRELRAEGREFAPSPSEVEAKLARFRSKRSPSQAGARRVLEHDPKQARDYEQGMRAQGLEKSFVDLPNGRRGFAWQRVTPLTNFRYENTPPPIKNQGKPSSPITDERADWNAMLRVLDIVQPKGASPEPAQTTSLDERKQG